MKQKQNFLNALWTAIVFSLLLFFKITSGRRMVPRKKSKQGKSDVEISINTKTVWIEKVLQLKVGKYKLRTLKQKDRVGSADLWFVS